MQGSLTGGFETLAAIRAAGKTIVFVSHDLGAIRDHCDRAMLLLDGSIQALGSPVEVLARYDTLTQATPGDTE